MAKAGRKKVPERDRDIVKFKDEEGWSFRQIARYFDMSVSSIHVAYNRHKKYESDLSTGGGLQGVR
jgi:DNA-directed RNA polymerase specialized sigma24 family protein